MSRTAWFIVELPRWPRAVQHLARACDIAPSELSLRRARTLCGMRATQAVVRPVVRGRPYPEDRLIWGPACARCWTPERRVMLALGGGA